MTTATKYYQAKNTQARLHGGPIQCPDCIGVVEHLAVTDTYACAHCAYLWDRNGDPIKTKDTP